jgi:Mn2+/Fe2+ NRAMP family transporter
MNSAHEEQPAGDGEATPVTGEEAIPAPRDFFGILKRLGPGLIIAGSIVGSGELIATTKTGAQAGITLLWLIVLGCVIKMFVQIELGRYAITHGETTLIALDRVPGPRFRVNWIVWFWLFMMLCTIGQLGGIVGGVGQSMAISMPFSGDYRRAIQVPSTKEITRYLSRDPYLLSEWDLRLVNEVSSAEEDLKEHFDVHERAWLKQSFESTSALIAGLDEARFAEIESQYEKLAGLQKANPPSLGVIASPTDEEIEARKQLQELLSAVNVELVRQFKESDKSPDAIKNLKEMTGPQLERALHGHEILSAQLADVDRDDHRGVAAASAAFALDERTEELDKLKKQDKTASDAEIAEAKQRVEQAEAWVKTSIEPQTWDDKIWAGVGALITIILLCAGRYQMLQNVSTVLVVAFTFITIGNVISLQYTEQWSISFSQLWNGLTFRLPESVPGEKDPLLTALATFGIIGVGATELITYPYWCLEKGYAKWTGPRSNDEAWAGRAKGWMRVMLYDAFLSMVVFTIATIAFYLMGVAVLFNEGRDPEGIRMVSTLAAAYVPVFGAYAGWLFLIGAIAVLYSTFLVANAGNARMYTDGCKVFGLISRDNPRTHEKALVFFSVLIPSLSFSMYLTGADPVTLVLIAGMAQAIMLPMIGIGSLYFRYRMTDPRLKPSRLWDTMLVLSCLGLLITGIWGVLSRL